MKPKHPLRPSAPKRHQLDRFDRQTHIKPVTTMVLPGIEVAEDIAAINRGEGMSLGNNRWFINHRLYVDKGDGTAFPASGEGVISPSRRELIGLQILISSGGDSDVLFERTHRTPGFDDKIRDEATRLFMIWSKAREQRK